MTSEFEDVIFWNSIDGFRRLSKYSEYVYDTLEAVPATLAATVDPVALRWSSTMQPKKMKSKLDIHFWV